MFKSEKELVTIDQIMPRQTWEREITRALETMPEGGDAQTCVVEHIFYIVNLVFPDKLDQVRKLLEPMKAFKYSNIKALFDDTAETMYSFIKDNYSAQELEQATRNYINRNLEKEGRGYLNELINYNVYKNQAYLHINPAYTFSDIKVAHLVKDGFVKFSRELEVKPELKDVGTIGTVSWLVAAKPDSLERLGFKYKGLIDAERKKRDFPDEERDVGEACIDREEFLKRYAGKFKLKNY